MSGTNANAAQKGALPPFRIPDCLGTNIHFLRGPENELDLLKASGFKWVRMDFFWGDIEKVKGKYDWSGTDALVDSLDKRGIKVMWILNYSNKLYEPTDSVRSVEGLKAYTDFCVEAVKRYHPKGSIFEFWNEPNGQFWKPQPGVDDYSKMVLQASDAIKKAVPDSILLAPALAGMDFPYLERFFKNGGLKYLDGVTVHPYRTSAPETVSPDFRRVRALIDRYQPAGKNLPLLSGEWGYSAQWAGVGEDNQGHLIVRQLLNNLSNQVRLSIWYDWKNDGSDPKEPEHHFGTVKPDLKPKLAYKSVKAMTGLLNGFEYFTRYETSDPDEYILVFKSGTRYALACWRTKEGEKEIKLPIWDADTPAPDQPQLHDMDGEEINADYETDGSLRLKLSQKPKYLILDRVPTTGFTWRIVENAFTAESGKPFNLTIELNNDTNAKYAIFTLKVDDQEIYKNFTLKPGENSLSVSLSSLLRDRASAPISVRLQTSYGASKVKDLGSRTAYLLVDDPLELTLLPAPGGGAYLRAEQPYTDERHDYTMSLLEYTWTNPRRSMVTFNGIEPSYHFLAPGTNNGANYSVRLLNADEKLIGDVSGQFVTSLDFSSGVTGWSTTLEGDSKVKAEAKVLAATSPPNPNDTPEFIKEKIAPSLTKIAKIEYRFDNGWRYWMLKPPPSKRKITGKPKEMGMWVYGDGKRNWLRCRFRDATGQTFQPNYDIIDWVGWKYVTMSMTEAFSWGGAADNKVHYPIEWDCPVLIDSASTTQTTSAIYVGPITFSY